MDSHPYYESHIVELQMKAFKSSKGCGERLERLFLLLIFLPRCSRWAILSLLVLGVCSGYKSLSGNLTRMGFDEGGQEKLKKTERGWTFDHFFTEEIFEKWIFFFNICKSMFVQLCCKISAVSTDAD